MSKMSRNQRCYMEFVSRNPGCSTADVDRACRVNPRAGHKHVYDGVNRLIRRGLLRRGSARQESARGGSVGLYVVERRDAGISGLEPGPWLVDDREVRP